MTRFHKDTWVKCGACGAHATFINGKFFCRKCGLEVPE